MFKPTRQYDSLILKALRQLKVQGPKDKFHGLCLNIKLNLIAEGMYPYHVSLAMERVDDLFAKWPESKNATFPVEGSFMQHMNKTAIRSRWTNPRRLALLDWMIAYLETQEANRDKPAVA